MKIHYVENKNGKLFSFYTHDFKSNTDEDGNYVMIDGGFDYIRSSGELKSENIKELMPEIRKQFVWGQNYDVNNVRLPKTIYKPINELTTSHITGILRYFTENLSENDTLTKSWIAIHLIFCYELENRLNNGIDN